nr:hypothetical protein [Spirochaetaceae bacterium]
IKISLLYTFFSMGLILITSMIIINKSQDFLEAQVVEVRNEQLNQLKYSFDENNVLFPREVIISEYFLVRGTTSFPIFFLMNLPASMN